MDTLWSQAETIYAFNTDNRRRAEAESKARLAIRNNEQEALKEAEEAEKKA